MATIDPTSPDLRGLGSEAELSAGAELWREGDPGEEVVFLLAGTLEVIHRDPEEEREVIVLRTLEPGAIIGEIAILDGQARSATVRARTDCRVLRIPASSFRELLRLRPDLLEQLFWQQMQRVRSLTSQITATHRRAITDRLTGLYNFGFFQDRLRMEIDRAGVTGDPVSLIIFDIDHFKHYNDTNGHQAGNEALVQIAVILQRAGRRGDILARYGGEEFVALLYGASHADACRFAEVVRRAVEKAHIRGRRHQPLGFVSLSGGVASFPEDADDDSGLIASADRRLYQAKQMGRNRISSSG